MDWAYWPNRDSAEFPEAIRHCASSIHGIPASSCRVNPYDTVLAKRAFECGLISIVSKSNLRLADGQNALSGRCYSTPSNRGLHGLRKLQFPNARLELAETLYLRKEISRRVEFVLQFFDFRILRIWRILHNSRDTSLLTDYNVLCILNDFKRF